MVRYTLRQLEYFITVGEMGSIARAAERLNVSPPSVSTSITQLEQEFGLPLFVRQHAQGMALTQGGRRLLDQARNILREAHLMTDIAADVAGSVRGSLAIGCLVSFAQLILPKLRRGYEQTFPEIRFRQSEMNQSDLFSALRRSDIDIAMTYDMDIPADLQFTGLIRLRPFAVLGADHPLADQGSVSIPELAGHPMVLLDLPISADYFFSLFRAVGRQPDIAERTRDMAVMRSLVGNGYGYSIINIRPHSETAPDGNPIRYIPIRGEVRALRMGLLTAQDAARSNVVRSFIDYTRDQAATGRLSGMGGERTG